jgi:hypothetical protein
MPMIRFCRSGANTRIGNFQAGDLMRCGDALAAHLVEQARVATWVDAPSAAETAAPVPAAVQDQAAEPDPAPVAPVTKPARKTKATKAAD